MKVLLVAINAKYIHSNLAVYSLRAYAKQKLGEGDMQVDIAEYTINQSVDDILKDIYKRRPDVLCLSCYIWNLIYIEEIVKELHKICPELDIWVGGPEVSYDAVNVLERLDVLKGVMKGEGEATFAEVCEAYGIAEHRQGMFDERLKKVKGITFRDERGDLIDNPWREPIDLSEVPFVYSDMKDFEHKIIYYESSRGCPFSCSYCLSSVDKRLRFRRLDLVKRELQFFIDHKVPQVKFVDRTFNCRHEHAMEIWQYIAGHDNGITNFHFEVAADLLSEEEIALIETMRPGLIQLEIGVQSTNPETIREIRRTMQFDKVREHVERIHARGNIHQHLDLIAGLPHEDIRSFARSFDDVYGLKPDQLQLGFLKVLKGSYMQEQQDRYGLKFKDMPPYEVLRTNWLTYDDVIELKGIEEMVEVYYNSGQFAHSIEELEKLFASAYEMYRDLWRHYEKHGYMEIQHKRSARYAILLDYVQEFRPQKEPLFRELLTYDYYLRENAKSRPEFAGEDQTDKQFVRKFYEREETERRYLPGYEKYDKNQMRKMTHLEYFPMMKKILLFDYKFRNPLNQEARTCIIEKGLKEGNEVYEL